MGQLYQDVKLSIKKNKKNSLNSKFILTKSTSEFEGICTKLETTYGLNINHLLGMGTSCITFKKPDSDEVIKICSRNIKYLKYKKTSLMEFVKESRAMEPYILPVNEMIMDTQSYFVYTQFACQPLNKKKPIDRNQYNNIFLIIRSLFSNGLLVGQLRPKNM